MYKLPANSFASGELQSVDGYMNIALEKTNEYMDGKPTRGYGDAFVRGNNGSFVVTLPPHVTFSTNAAGQCFISRQTDAALL